MKIVALAGGVGGAKLVDGLARLLPPEDLTIIVNTGDDFDHLGLRICPDLDTVCYTLAGLANPVSGWGRLDETWNALAVIAQLGGPDWFKLGDWDLGTHLERTRRLQSGQTLSQITNDFCNAWGIAHTVLPMSDDPVPTMVISDEGVLPFQEYFVRRQCKPRVMGFRFEGVGAATPAPGVIFALQAASLVVICPSNPWVSIDPILSVPGIQETITSLKSPTIPSDLRQDSQIGESTKVLAISPIIGGQAVKGPAAKMFSEMGIVPSALAVAAHYGDLLDGFVYDVVDSDLERDLQALKIHTYRVNTLMKSSEDRQQLAIEVISFGKRLHSDTIVRKERKD
jgi:LPPG:FO 2-phospho-L-lactate transferase